MDGYESSATQGGWVGLDIKIEDPGSLLDARPAERAMPTAKDAVAVLVVVPIAVVAANEVDAIAKGGESRIFSGLDEDIAFVLVGGEQKGGADGSEGGVHGALI